MDVVKKIEATKTNSRDQPLKEVKIADSGSIAVDTPFKVSKD